MARPKARQPSRFKAYLAVGLPACYFGIRYSAIASSLQTKADVKAEVIKQAIGASPDPWRFEEHRLGKLLVRFPVASFG